MKWRSSCRPRAPPAPAAMHLTPKRTSGVPLSLLPHESPSHEHCAPVQAGAWLSGRSSAWSRHACLSEQHLRCASERGHSPCAHLRTDAPRRPSGIRLSPVTSRYVSASACGARRIAAIGAKLAEAKATASIANDCARKFAKKAAHPTSHDLQTAARLLKQAQVQGTHTSPEISMLSFRPVLGGHPCTLCTTRADTC